MDMSQSPELTTAYTMPEILGLITLIGAQLGILIAAIFAGIAARDARRIAADTKEETRAQTVKIDTVAKDTAVVLGHVNSEKTSDAKTIEFQARENQMLRDQMAEKDRTAGLLAQAAATASPVTGAGAVPVLAQIETNMDATAKNTAKTDATVTELKKKAKP